MWFKNVGLIIGVISIVLSLGGSDAIGAAITMKIGYATANDAQDQAGKLLKQKIEAGTNGKVNVQLFPASQLGNNQQIIQGVSNGSIEGNLQPTAFLGGFAPLLTIADLPFLWKDRESVEKVLNDPEVSKPLFDILAQKGIKGLSFYEYGPKNFLTTFSLDETDALSKHKFRVMQAPVLIDQYKAWNIIAIPTSMGEVYTALQQKTIEGLENTPDHFYQNKFFEVAPYYTESSHGHLVLIFIVNGKWFNSLPQDIQQTIAKVSVDIAPDVRKWGENKDQESLEKMKSSGKVTVKKMSSEQLNLLRSKSQVIYDNFIKINPGADSLIKVIRKKQGS